MVATSDCVVKSRTITGNKVSKPLMEKKRRARINKCLDQLKTLLESYYTNSIRKRKLEKADILELTVKHLRNLQNIQSCPTAASEFSDHQTGFRSCLANVNQYLLIADNLNGSDRWMLSQLCGKLRRSQGPREVSSTTESAPRPDEAQRLHPSASGSEGQKTVKTRAIKHQNANKSNPPPGGELSSGNKPTHVVSAPTQNTHEKTSTHYKFHSVSHGRNEVTSTLNNVWRPWVE
ncbi:hypothetical protein LDENG_00064260 [Lucifuga dentata]|nr:hypothetical protein LDENG_00064260 [Lucifuga dentata]